MAEHLDGELLDQQLSAIASAVSIHSSPGALGISCASTSFLKKKLCRSAINKTYVCVCFFSCGEGHDLKIKNNGPRPPRQQANNGSSFLLV